MQLEVLLSAAARWQLASSTVDASEDVLMRNKLMELSEMHSGTTKSKRHVCQPPYKDAKRLKLQSFSSVRYMPSNT